MNRLRKQTDKHVGTSSRVPPKIPVIPIKRYGRFFLQTLTKLLHALTLEQLQGVCFLHKTKGHVP